MAYYPEVQKEYQRKLIQVKAVYGLKDAEEGLRVKAYLAQTGQAVNDYLKQIIKADLDSRGFALDTDSGADSTP